MMGKMFRCNNGASNLKKRRNADFFNEENSFGLENKRANQPKGYFMTLA
jgi:hypothetical protein